ncbi:MAG: GNAT family N-acetyltransferase [Ignavibacteriaceae bacterium]|jgi:ribosomal protein S18 acetylase RimI-like enzyme|nr:GNAT family N-acetyltransferase [Ignavibacteriaceae bacterium]MCU0414607.1 GNAT family N-acetyltransferase [Ignavibacteriaceae bacterium]
MIVRPPQTEEEFERYRDLRWRILRAPWNQPRITAQDDLENDDFPIMVCEVDGIPIGVGRAHFISENEAQIRSISVEQEWEGKGIGSIVLKELEKIVIAKGATRIIIHSRNGAIEFYKKNGYKEVEPSYELFGEIEHTLMEKFI